MEETIYVLKLYDPLVKKIKTYQCSKPIISIDNNKLSDIKVETPEFEIISIKLDMEASMVHIYNKYTKTEIEKGIFKQIPIIRIHSFFVYFKKIKTALFDSKAIDIYLSDIILSCIKSTKRTLSFKDQDENEYSINLNFHKVSGSIATESKREALEHKQKKIKLIKDELLYENSDESFIEKKKSEEIILSGNNRRILDESESSHEITEENHMGLEKSSKSKQNINDTQNSKNVSSISNSSEREIEENNVVEESTIENLEILKPVETVDTKEIKIEEEEEEVIKNNSTESHSSDKIDNTEGSFSSENGNRNKNNEENNDINIVEEKSEEFNIENKSSESKVEFEDNKIEKKRSKNPKFVDPRIPYAYETADPATLTPHQRAAITRRKNRLKKLNIELLDTE